MFLRPSAGVRPSPSWPVAVRFAGLERPLIAAARSVATVETEPDPAPHREPACRRPRRAHPRPRLLAAAAAADARRARDLRHPRRRAAARGADPPLLQDAGAARPAAHDRRRPPAHHRRLRTHRPAGEADHRRLAVGRPAEHTRYGRRRHRRPRRGERLRGRRLCRPRRGPCEPTRPPIRSSGPSSGLPCPPTSCAWWCRWPTPAAKPGSYLPAPGSDRLAVEARHPRAAPDDLAALRFWRIADFDVTASRRRSTDTCSVRRPGHPSDERLVALAEVRDVTPVRNNDGTLASLPDGAHADQLHRGHPPRSDDASRARRLHFNHRVPAGRADPRLPLRRHHRRAAHGAPDAGSASRRSPSTSTWSTWSREPREVVLRISSQPGPASRVQRRQRAQRAACPVDD